MTRLPAVPPAHVAVLRRLGLLVALVAGVLLAACSGDDAATPADDAPTIVTPSPVPDDEVEEERVLEGTVVTPDQLTAGDCFNQYEVTDPDTEDAREVTTVVDCRRPHDGEVYTVILHPSAAEDPFPGRVELDRWANARCWEAFESSIGAEYEVSALELATILPLPDQWEVGLYREIKCYAYAPAGQLSGVVSGSGL